MSELHAIPCDQVLQTLVLYIDHELATEQDYQIYQIHFQECPPCHELLVHESESLSFMQNLLRSACNEQAPEDLHDRIRRQISVMSATAQVEYFSQTTITNFSFDGTTSIQVTQEFTTEIRHDLTDGE